MTRIENGSGQVSEWAKSARSGLCATWRHDCAKSQRWIHVKGFERDRVTDKTWLLYQGGQCVGAAQWTDTGPKHGTMTVWGPPIEPVRAHTPGQEWHTVRLSAHEWQRVLGRLGVTQRPGQSVHKAIKAFAKKTPAISGT